MSRIKLIGMALVLTAMGLIGTAERAEAVDWTCVNQCATAYNSCKSSRGTNCESQFTFCKCANCGLCSC